MSAYVPLGRSHVGLACVFSTAVYTVMSLLFPYRRCFARSRALGLLFEADVCGAVSSYVSR